MRSTVPHNVLLVVHIAQHSGPQRSLIPRLESLAARGTRITTLVPAPGPAADAAAELGPVIPGGPTALAIPRGLREIASLPLRLRSQYRSVRKAIEASSAELVIISSALIPGAFVATRRSRVATMLYSGEVLGGRDPRGLAQRRAARFAAARADIVLASSETAAAVYRENGVATTVLNPAIEIDSDGTGPEATERAAKVARRAAGFRERLGITPDERVVSSLGAITEGRGQDLLLDAAMQSAARAHHWRLVIAGAPYDRPADVAFDRKLREVIAENGLQDRVLMTGAIDDPTALYAASDVFVNPVRIPESFGRASCEALVAGCPVVSTRIGGTSEALKHNETALLVAPDKPAELSAAIDRLLQDRELANSLVSEGRRDIAARFHPTTGEHTFMQAITVAQLNNRKSN